MSDLLDKLTSMLAETEKATPGPWKKDLCIMDGALYSQGGREETLANAEFIAAARTNHPAALRALIKAVGILKCNETFHRLGGLDDCDPCKALAEIEEIFG